MLDFLNPILGRKPDRIKANVEIYTWQTCPYCIRAKTLLWWKGVNNEHVGGCDDIYKLDRDGQLDALLAQPAV
jgi:glutaredoxin 3